VYPIEVCAHFLDWQKSWLNFYDFIRFVESIKRAVTTAFGHA